MTTLIIVGVVIVIGLIALARIMKWWRAPIVEKAKTERRKNWYEFRKWLRSNRLFGRRKF